LSIQVVFDIFTFNCGLAKNAEFTVVVDGGGYVTR